MANFGLIAISATVVSFLIFFLLLMFIVIGYMRRDKHIQREIQENIDVNLADRRGQEIINRSQVPTVSTPQLERTISIPMAYDDIYTHSSSVTTIGELRSATTEEMPPRYEEIDINVKETQNIDK
ncbi:CLUMA_CG018125, isoform A [Clunio marinus]|uniref:CLUMA_CG018125, isoform A n=1 Tax=Clunio marinus TaxID=568069 RepID=A0A1J1IZ64_9DIPT|nr:CLUMA_CG018125, isoform A [Clunio marinus]